MMNNNKNKTYRGYHPLDLKVLNMRGRGDEEHNSGERPLLLIFWLV